MQILEKYLIDNLHSGSCLVNKLYMNDYKIIHDNVHILGVLKLTKQIYSVVYMRRDKFSFYRKDMYVFS